MEDKESGSLSQKSPLDLIVELYRDSVTGSLKFDRAPLQKAIFFREGQILFAASDEASFMTGTYPLQHGLYGLETVSLRYFNVFGPRQRDDSPYTGVIAIFIRRLLDGLPVTIFGDGEQTRDFTYVANAVQANLLALGANEAGGEVYNVGAGQRVSLNQLFETLADLIAPGTQVSYGPTREGDVRHSLADLSRIAEGLGYTPEVHLEEGLRQTVDWYRSCSK